MLDAEMDKTKVLQCDLHLLSLSVCVSEAAAVILQVAHGQWGKAKLRDLALDTHEQLPSFGAIKPRKEPRKQDTGTSPRKVCGFRTCV